MIRHKFVVIEGVDGVGKTTVAKLVAREMNGAYYKTPSIPFSNIREEVDQRANANARFHFYLSSVLFAWSEIVTYLEIAPVVCDRWIYSTLAYHKALGYCPPNLKEIEELKSKPDYSWLLFVGEKERKARVSARSPSDTSFRWMELDSAFLMAVNSEFESNGLRKFDTSHSEPIQVAKSIATSVINGE